MGGSRAMEAGWSGRLAVEAWSYRGPWSQEPWPWRHGSMGAMGVEGQGGRVERGKGGGAGARSAWRR